MPLVGGAVGYWVPTSGSSVQVEPSGLAGASGFQDIKVRNLETTGTALFASTVTASTVVRAADGAVGAPSYSFTNFTSTGWYAAAGPILSAATAGVERGRFTGTGLSLGGLVLGFGASFAVAVDVGIGRSALGILEVNIGASGGLASLRHYRNVQAPGTSTLLASQSGDVFTNAGVATLTLPEPAPVGCHYLFVQQSNANAFTVKAGTLSKIRAAGSLSAANGTAASSVIGDCIELVAVTTTEWEAVAIVGTWTIT